jgi:hypothetical protein
MKKLISFCLWGNNKKYTIGAIKNAKLAQEIYPGWICRFYTGQSVPKDIIDELKKIDNTEIIQMNEPGNNTSMFWRFLPASENNIEMMISRDTDSRLNLREKLAVDEWINSDKGFHIMRDHPYHRALILGGMWGTKNNIISNIGYLINNFNKANHYGIDQNFLAHIIYPIIKNNCMVHDEFFNFDKVKRSFPTKRINKEFVGEIIDHDDNRFNQHWKFL